jgi:ribose-phosphate pyrophosphokinase
VLCGPAIERIKGSQIKQLVVADTIPLDKEKKIDNIAQLSVSDLLGEAIRRIHNEETVSALFE